MTSIARCLTPHQQPPFISVCLLAAMLFFLALDRQWLPKQSTPFSGRGFICVVSSAILTLTSGFRAAATQPSRFCSSHNSLPAFVVRDERPNTCCDSCTYELVLFLFMFTVLMWVACSPSSPPCPKTVWVNIASVLLKPHAACTWIHCKPYMTDWSV